MALRFALCAVLAVVCVSSGAATYLPDGVIGTAYKVTMRDGTPLYTIVTKPLFDDKPRTCVMDRSPYGRDGTELIAAIYLLFDFVAVRQDMRGTKRSGGNFTMWASAADDAYDTMEWIAKQSWSNGDVYTVGASADGLASFAMIENSPPWLKAQMIIFASSEGHPIIFPGGAFRKSLTEFWLQKTVPDQYDRLIKIVRANEAPGSWWNRLNATKYYGNVDFPSVMWAGWYDIFLVGNLLGFDGYQNDAASGSTGKGHLVVDPLGHCQKGAKYFPKNLIAGRAILPLLLSIDLFKQTSFAENVSAITFYVMGSSDEGAVGGYWTSLDKWPERIQLPFYLSANNVLTPFPPNATNVATSASFVYDPSNPVPSMGGNNLEIECGPLDQRPIENRTDMLLFTSKPFIENVALTGPVDAVLYVKSNCTDTDFTVKLTDVYPDGQSRLIQDGIVRMRWRELPNPTPQPITPGQVYEVRVSLWNTSYIVTKGHALRVAVSSSNFPRFSANPNNGLALNQTGPTLIAENTVLFSAEYPSRIILPQVQQSDLPPFPVLVDEHSFASMFPDDRTAKAAELWRRMMNEESFAQE